MSNSPEALLDRPLDIPTAETDISSISYLPASVLACQTLIMEGNRLDSEAPVYDLAKKCNLTPTYLRANFIDQHGKENNLWQGDLANAQKSKRHIELTETGLAYGVSHEPIQEVSLRKSRFSHTDYYLLKIFIDGGGEIKATDTSNDIFTEIHNRLQDEGYCDISLDNIYKVVSRAEAIDCLEMSADLVGPTDKPLINAVSITKAGKDYFKILNKRFEQGDGNNLKIYSPHYLIRSISLMEEEIRRQAMILGEDYTPYELSGEETYSDFFNIIENLEAKMNCYIPEIDRRQQAKKDLGLTALSQ